MHRANSLYATNPWDHFTVRQQPAWHYRDEAGAVVKCSN